MENAQFHGEDVALLKQNIAYALRKTRSPFTFGEKRKREYFLQAFRNANMLIENAMGLDETGLTKRQILELKADELIKLARSLDGVAMDILPKFYTSHHAKFNHESLRAKLEGGVGRLMREIKHENPNIRFNFDEGFYSDAKPVKLVDIDSLYNEFRLDNVGREVVGHVFIDIGTGKDNHIILPYGRERCDSMQGRIRLVDSKDAYEFLPLSSVYLAHDGDLKDVTLLEKGSNPIRLFPRDIIAVPQIRKDGYIFKPTQVRGVLLQYMNADKLLI